MGCTDIIPPGHNPHGHDPPRRFPLRSYSPRDATFPLHNILESQTNKYFLPDFLRCRRNTCRQYLSWSRSNVLDSITHGGLHLQRFDNGNICRMVVRHGNAYIVTQQTCTPLLCNQSTFVGNIPSGFGFVFSAFLVYAKPSLINLTPP